MGRWEGERERIREPARRRKGPFILPGTLLASLKSTKKREKDNKNKNKNIRIRIKTRIIIKK